MQNLPEMVYSKESGSIVLNTWGQTLKFLKKNFLVLITACLQNHSFVRQKFRTKTSYKEKITLSLYEF